MTNPSTSPVLQRAAPSRYHFSAARALYYNARRRFGADRALYYNARRRLGTASVPLRPSITMRGAASVLPLGPSITMRGADTPFAFYKVLIRSE